MSKNLINLKERSSSDRTRIARLGALASANKKRENKTLRDELITILNSTDENGDTIKQKMSLSLVSQALNGNIKSYELIHNIVYGKNYKIDLENVPIIVDDINQ